MCQFKSADSNVSIQMCRFNCADSNVPIPSARRVEEEIKLQIKQQELEMNMSHRTMLKKRSGERQLESLRKMMCLTDVATVVTHAKVQG